ncbi:hypothetical protein FM076_19435 [Streptomyces albus subsp. chlorinus]|uniref:hypothetical protein n=1 Tax=Streptomyces albus TaxID=1888 RepID=UPI001570E0A7|nr:hypothetical protein [Streptomyces albus]NSC23206.1 hypothetical protein [Streptomyces albus subsp. chlorinus]
MKRVGAAILLAGAATVAPLAGTAAAADGPRAQNVLNCRTEAIGKQGWAHCTNNTDQAVAFRVTVVCGVGFDGSGEWVTLNPGASGSSGFECGELSTGAGSVSWEEG